MFIELTNNYVFSLYFIQHLPQYSKDCCAIYPPTNLYLPVPKVLPPGTIPLVYKSYRENKLDPPPTTGGATEDTAEEVVVTDTPTPPPGTSTQPVKPSDKAVVSPPDGELCVQW